jgi:hypothetical protein
MRLVRSAVLVAAAAVAVAAVPTAAVADGSSHTDAPGDVQSVAVDANGIPTDTTLTAEPTATNGDITSVHAANGARKVKVVFHFADLRPAGDGEAFSVLIATPTRERLAIVAAQPGHWGGKAILANVHGKKVRCTVGHKISYDRRKVVVKVPRSCLGQPKVIKVGARSFIADGTKLFFDDAYSVAGPLSPYSLSPRIHR